MVAEDPTPLSGSLIDLLRAAYLQRLSGFLELPGGPLPTLYVRRGELHLDRDEGGRSAELLALVQREGGSARPEAPLKEATEKLGRDLAAITGKVNFRSGAGGAVELVGPLPTVHILLELATTGAAERQLIERLGGENAKIRGKQDTPALKQLAGLDGEMARAMMVVDQNAALGDLLGSTSQRQVLLRGLVKLWAVGLMAVDAPAAAGAKTEIVTPKAVQRFLDRMAENLEDDPLDLDVEKHRAAIAALFSRLSKLDHYELLEIAIGASDEALLKGFNQVARLVHPQHAARLGLQGKEDTLRVLFERAIEAYLTLSDPLRRSSYNNLMGLRQDLKIHPEQRTEEKRRLAKILYHRGTDALSTMDYSTAVDLLKEAARMDPQAGYFAALGQAQAKNPNWRKQAVGSYEKALELDPESIAAHLAFGQVLEQLGEKVRATQEYDKVLSLMPNNPAALDGKGRLTGEKPNAGTEKKGLRSALGWRR